MNTRALIDAVLAAQAQLADAESAFASATAALDAARTALANASLALHDDLVANGAVLYVDESTTPPSYTIYSAAEPDTFTATPIRAAA
jgi:hypothetical protein